MMQPFGCKNQLENGVIVPVKYGRPNVSKFAKLKFVVAKFKFVVAKLKVVVAILNSLSLT